MQPRTPYVELQLQFFIYSIFSYEFLRTSATELNDGGRDLLMKQRGFQLINPTEKWFPGIEEKRQMFASWDWRYGKTPNFSVIKDIKLKSGHDVKVKVTVCKGIIDGIVLMMPNCDDEMTVVSGMVGQAYTEENINNIECSLKGAAAENVKQAMNRL